MPKKLDIKPGDRFGRLTIIQEVEKMNQKRYFLCKCDCGNKKAVRLGSLSRGAIKSCGCLLLETGMRSKIHGQWKSRLYGIWRDMKQRCTNPNCKNYKHYGGRGIKVCEEWLEANNFIDWALSSGYSDNLTLDRKDCNKGYNPDNCQWATIVAQQNNRRNNHRLKFNGKNMTIKEWSNQTGLNPETIRRRIADGWDVKTALTLPPRVVRKATS